MLIAIIVIVVLVIVLVLIAIGLNNSMIGARNRVDESWSGIDVQLKRRHDLVPNLVETVKGYATHEREVFEKVTSARAEATKAHTPAEAAQKEGQLTQALTDLRAVAENYPDLRATENFQKLQNELTEIEDEIQASRRIYNSNVQSFNTKIQVFPNSIIAKNRGFTEREFFEIEDAADREPVQVSFGSAPA
jgi:LemA protein